MVVLGKGDGNNTWIFLVEICTFQGHYEGPSLQLKTVIRIIIVYKIMLLLFINKNSIYNI